MKDEVKTYTIRTTDEAGRALLDAILATTGFTEVDPPPAQPSPDEGPSCKACGSLMRLVNVEEGDLGPGCDLCAPCLQIYGSLNARFTKASQRHRDDFDAGVLDMIRAIKSGETYPEFYRGLH